MELFGIGLPELIVIMALALVLIGPERLPEVAGQVGRAVADLRRQANQLSTEFQQSLEVAATERKQQRLVATPTTAPSFCPSCGARAADEARFCSSCGASLAAPVTDGERTA